MCVLIVSNRRFLYDGERIGENDTPSSLDMDDNGTFSSFSVRS